MSGGGKNINPTKNDQDRDLEKYSPNSLKNP
jgi:hypothetical protein